MGSYYAEKLHEYADPAPPVPTEFTPEPKGIAYTFPEVVTGLLRSSIAFEVSACVVAYYVYMTYFWQFEIIWKIFNVHLYIVTLNN